MPAAFPDTVLDGSGLRSAIGYYTRTTRLLSFLDKGRLAEIDNEALTFVLGQQFQPDPFYRAIAAQVRKSYTPDRLPPLDKWFHSPLARKLADLERAAYAPDSRPALVEFAAALTNKPPPESRLLLIHRIYDAFRTSDMEVETTIAIVAVIAEAIGPALPADKRYSMGELNRALGPVKSRYRSVMKNARIVQDLFAYRTASDAELEQYAAFLESGAGKWLNSVVENGFFDAAQSISKSLRYEIPRKVKKQSSIRGRTIYG